MAKRRIPIPKPKEIRKLVKELYGNQCAYCGEKNRKILQIHHIDHDPSNNDIHNLVLICVWCHFYEHGDVGIIEWAIRKGLME